MGRIVRAARAAFTGAAVLTAGFFLSGGATRVSALAHELARSPGTEPIEGSRPGAPRIVLLDGSPARMRRCLAPASSSLEGVLDHYERVASRESALPGRKQLPYIVSFDGDSACVIWTNARDLARRGVLVSRTAAGIEYSLLDGDPPSGGAPARAESARPILPGGVRGPAGSRMRARVEDGPAGFACIEVEGSPVEVGDKLEAALSERGFSVATEARAALEGASPAKGSCLVLPFRSSEHNGVVVVSALGPGVSRATFALR